MKHHILKNVLTFTFFFGIALLLYPFVSDYLNSRHQSRVVQNYQEASNQIDDSRKEELLRQAADYNKRLAETEGAFYNPDLVEGYMNTLDITGTGIMGYLNIDKIHLELPVYHTVGKDVLQIAVGHLPGTSLPVGGAGTHTVLSGHRGLPRAKLFTDLDKLEIGDRFTITVLSEVYTYQVEQTKNVEPYEVDDLQIEPKQDICTLFTCTPYGINTQRLFVRAKRVPTEEITERRIFYTNEAYRVTPAIVAPVIALSVLLVLYIVMLISNHRKKRIQKAKAAAKYRENIPDEKNSR
ncbi:MAG: class C sortase [Oscillospiraceae bacterium]|nr:class C sortase [Oscillospiraceae bacterium]